MARLEAARASLSAAEARLSAARSRYENGTGTMAELTDAREMLAQAEAAVAMTTARARPDQKGGAAQLSERLAQTMAARALLVGVEERVRLAEARHQAGQESMLAVVEARVELANARANLALAEDRLRRSQHKRRK